MCFSPDADFTAGAVVSGIGVATLRRVRVRRELIVGALPLLFGLHQLVEAFVWLRLRDEVSAGVGDAAKETYVVFAHAALPALVPLGFTLLEPDRRRARWMWPLVGLGSALGAYLLWQVTAFPVAAYPLAHCVDYVTHTPNDLVIGVAYVLVTCGPALISSPPRPALVRPGEPGGRDRRGARALRRAHLCVVCVRVTGERAHPAAFPSPALL
jgi:hypothetical protein